MSKKAAMTSLAQGLQPQVTDYAIISTGILCLCSSLLVALDLLVCIGRVLHLDCHPCAAAGVHIPAKVGLRWSHTCPHHSSQMQVCHRLGLSCLLAPEQAPSKALQPDLATACPSMMLQGDMIPSTWLAHAA